MKVYVTKWAVGGGIQVFDGDEIGRDTVRWRSRGWDHYAHKGEWFKTLEEAQDDAARRIARKIASLKKQVAKLESGPIPVEDHTESKADAA